MFSGRNRIWWNVVTGKMHLQSIVTYTYLNVPFGNVFSEVQMQAISVNTVFCSAMAVVSIKILLKKLWTDCIAPKKHELLKNSSKGRFGECLHAEWEKECCKKTSTIRNRRFFQVSLWFEIVFPFHKHLPLYSFDLAIPTSQSTLDMSGFVASSCLLRQIKLSRMF